MSRVAWGSFFLGAVVLWLAQKFLFPALASKAAS